MGGSPVILSAGDWQIMTGDHTWANACIMHACVYCCWAESWLCSLASFSRVYSYLADQKTVTCTVKLTTPPFPELEIKLAELNHGSRHAWALWTRVGSNLLFLRLQELATFFQILYINMPVVSCDLFWRVRCHYETKASSFLSTKCACDIFTLFSLKKKKNKVCLRSLSRSRALPNLSSQLSRFGLNLALFMHLDQETVHASLCTGICLCPDHLASPFFFPFSSTFFPLKIIGLGTR